MTKSEVIKEFFKKSVLPVAVAALLYCIFKSACTKDGVTDYVWLFILCGLPFGIPRMFAWIVPGGSLGTALPLFLLNFIIGGVIGGFVLVWRLLVAAWYSFFLSAHSAWSDKLRRLYGPHRIQRDRFASPSVGCEFEKHLSGDCWPRCRIFRFHHNRLQSFPYCCVTPPWDMAVSKSRNCCHPVQSASGV